MSAVRWRGTALWPSVRAQIPYDRTPVVDHDIALKHGLDVVDAAELPEQRRTHFTRLWTAALSTMLPSGLLMFSASSFAPLLGHTSPHVPKQWLAWCLGIQLLLWVRGETRPTIPGKGRRSLYLVTQPA